MIFALFFLFLFELSQCSEIFWRSNKNKALKKTHAVSNSYFDVDKKFYPYVGNGYVGFFNGLAKGYEDVSHRASVPNPFECVQFEKNFDKQNINLYTQKGYIERISTFGSASVSELFYAHRKYKNLLIYEQIQSDLQNPICYKVYNKTDSKDVNIRLKSNFTLNGILFGNYEIKTLIGERVKSEVQTLNFIRPLQLHQKQCSLQSKHILGFNISIESFKELASNKNLFYEHTEQWSNLMEKKGISVEGNSSLNDIILTSQYYILSSLSEEINFSPSPGTISSNAYNGHVFWDFETWMFPTVLMMYPDMAKSALFYRIERLEGAKEKSKSEGLKGANFPWESALTGLETCPEFAATGQREIHINNDIVFAIKSFFDSQKITSDEALSFYKVSKEISDFWVSRSTKKDFKNESENNCLYDIKNVIPPDEYKDHADNSIFTNAGTKITLDFTTSLADLVGETPDPKWNEISQNLCFPQRKEETSPDPEFKNYNGELIKQADVVLLTWPLQWITEEEKKRSFINLEYYSSRTDPAGPAMTHGVNSIIYNTLSLSDKAYSEFTKGFSENVVAPFYVWTECIGKKGAINFITGAGNFLNSILYGYFGLKNEGGNGLTFNPKNIPNTQSITFNGLSFKGNIFNVKYDQKNFTISCVKGAIYVFNDNFSQKLHVGDSTTQPLDKFAVTLRCNK